MKWAALLGRFFALEPARVGSIAATLYGVGAVLYRAEVAHTSLLQPDVLVAAAAAVWGLWTRAKVTPLADPKDDKGRALKPSQLPPPAPQVPGK